MKLIVFTGNIYNLIEYIVIHTIYSFKITSSASVVSDSRVAFEKYYILVLID